LRTRLELIIKSHGVKPARLAAQASYSRGHLARAREGEPTSQRFQEEVTTTIRRIVRRRVSRTELFEPEGVPIRTLLQQTTAGRKRRKTSSQQFATSKNLGVLVGALSDADFEAWLARVRTNAGAATEAATRDLVDAAFPLLDRQPARAEQLYAAAVGLTERLATSSPLLVLALRGYAEKGRANALRMLGRYQEAMQVLIDAEQHFVDARYCTLEIGEVRYARAGILFKMQRWPQAQEAADQARRIFEEEHDRTRALHARVIEGCVLVERGNLDAARAVFVSLLKQLTAKRHRDTLARVYMNLGACDLRRREPAIARHWLRRASQLLREIGTPSELARARWCGAKITIFEGDRTRGMRELRGVMHEFERLSMLADAGFAGLDLLEQLLADGSAAKEAERLARSLAEFFVAAHVNVSAARAIAYLRDAATARTADAPLVAYVRNYVHHADIESDKPFEPPPSGVEPVQ
jgi:tetratricopeptide (TPR) repeat protein